MPSNGPHPSSAIFLLSSASPEQNGIGSIFLRDLLERCPDQHISWHVAPPFLLRLGRSHQGTLMRAINSLLTRLGPWHVIRLALFRHLRLKRTLDRVEAEFLASKATKLWITTSSPELIEIAAEMSERGYDVRLTVWDAPEYLAQNLRLSRRSTKIIQDLFTRALRSARACSVVSRDMLQTYSNHAPDLPLVIMRHGIAPVDKATCRPVATRLRIVFAGSLYSKDEWNAFVDALEVADWHIAGRDVELVFIGHFPIKGAKRPKHMIHHPPMPQPAALDLMAEMDIGYLPYWLDPRKEFVARTSFPGKLTAYSAAGLAIFHHGPETSSVTRFLDQYPYGVACDSLAPKTVLDRLEKLVTALASETTNNARHRAMESELSDTAMHKAFLALMSDHPTSENERPA